jgi:hypothetical protein
MSGNRTSIPIYLASFMRVLLVVGVDANDQTYFKRAPFYNALIRTWPNYEANLVLHHSLGIPLVVQRSNQT